MKWVMSRYRCVYSSVITSNEESLSTGEYLFESITERLRASPHYYSIKLWTVTFFCFPWNKWRHFQHNLIKEKCIKWRVCVFLVYCDRRTTGGQTQFVSTAKQSTGIPWTVLLGVRALLQWEQSVQNRDWHLNVHLGQCTRWWIFFLILQQFPRHGPLGDCWAEMNCWSSSEPCVCTVPHFLYKYKMYQSWRRIYWRS